MDHAAIAANALTADEKDLLALMARDPDEVVWRTRYRILKLPGHDKDDGQITRRINALRARPDAQLALDQQRRELERNRFDAMQAADGANWQREKARAELEESTYRLAQAAMDHELGKFKPGGKPSTPSSVAKLLETGLKIAGTEGSSGGMSPEERLLLAKRAGIVESKPDEMVAVPLPHGVEEGKA